MLRKKTSIQEHQAAAEKQLTDRMQLLQSEGLTERDIQRDAKIRHYKGKIRQTIHQLAAITKLENQMTLKAEIKAEKMASPQTSAPKKRHAVNPEKKKTKKERRIAVETDA